jgi:hypothetical protein
VKLRCRVKPQVSAPTEAHPFVTVPRPQRDRTACSLAAEKLLLDACDPASSDAEVVRTDDVQPDLCVPYKDLKLQTRRKLAPGKALNLFVAMIAGYHEVQTSLHEKAVIGRVQLKVCNHALATQIAKLVKCTCQLATSSLYGVIR